MDTHKRAFSVSFFLLNYLSDAESDRVLVSLDWQDFTNDSLFSDNYLFRFFSIFFFMNDCWDTQWVNTSECQTSDPK